MNSAVPVSHEVARLLAAFLLTYAVGFERELRGSSAGNRTFSLVGLAGGLAGLYAVTHNAATAFSGVITGVGFIGAAVTARVAAKPADDGGDAGGLVKGLTTATTIVAAAAIGSACGAGLLTPAVLASALVLVTLEIRWIPGLRWLDANAWASRVRSETSAGEGLTAEPTATDADSP